jgi:hypothetical protein
MRDIKIREKRQEMNGRINDRKTHLCSLLSLICSALLCFSCFSPTLEDALSGTTYGQDEDGNEKNSGESEPLYDNPNDDDPDDEDGSSGGVPKDIRLTSFVLDAVTGLPVDDELTNAAGKVIATLTVPDLEGPWTPELDPDVEDNGLFEIVPLEGGERTYEIRIDRYGGLLPIGPYKVVLRIENAVEKVYHRTIEFSVSRTPPPFSQAATLSTSLISPGKNKLVVKRNQLPSGATGWRPYIGTSANAAEARPYGDVTLDISLEITDIEGDEAEGRLPDGTTYYVWCRPSNSEGEGGFGPVAICISSDPIDPYWWEDIDWWDTIDSYEFYFNNKNELVIGYSTKSLSLYSQGYVPGGNLDRQRWIVRYHVSFDPEELNKQIPHTTYGHYTTMEDLTGAPAGVFIVETPEEKPFYAVFYWGHRTIQTADIIRSDPSSPTGRVSLTGTVHSYLSNAWNSGSGGYAVTLEEAIQHYVGNNRRVGIWAWVAFVATPWYPVKNGGYKYGTPIP